MFLKKLYMIIATTLLLITINGVAHAAEFTVEIKGMDFIPNNLSLSTGDKVIFINKDAAPHTATAKDSSFDTGRLTKGMSSTITITKSGDFNYFCKVHPSMEGKITAK